MRAFSGLLRGAIPNSMPDPILGFIGCCEFQVTRDASFGSLQISRGYSIASEDRTCSELDDTRPHYCTISVLNVRHSDQKRLPLGKVRVMVSSTCQLMCCRREVSLRIVARLSKGFVSNYRISVWFPADRSLRVQSMKSVISLMPTTSMTMSLP